MIIEKARADRRGGGVAIFLKANLLTTEITLPLKTTFEAVCAQVLTGNGHLILLLVYRPGSIAPTEEFFDELTTVLADLVVKPMPLLIGGDFNLHVQDIESSDFKCF